ncbi:hypothetical protein EVAR_6417_1 [Eumeta japonica]|uniref:Uncharacterized protein n=1 Tax=Eumeta variegata TaxID=151549 RepID=A0A4C1TFQ5_EUMVA|nr:hypothetical protein EVAR_6417_1 [Eumeta japonica]
MACNRTAVVNMEGSGCLESAQYIIRTQFRAPGTRKQLPTLNKLSSWKNLILTVEDSAIRVWIQEEFSKIVRQVCDMCEALPPSSRPSRPSRNFLVNTCTGFARDPRVGQIWNITYS